MHSAHVQRLMCSWRVGVLQERAVNCTLGYPLVCQPEVVVAVQVPPRYYFSLSLPQAELSAVRSSFKWHKGQDVPPAPRSMLHYSEVPLEPNEAQGLDPLFVSKETIQQQQVGKVPARQGSVNTP